jgi:hypothetical protein
MKIDDKLGPSDFSLLADAFGDEEIDSIELLPTIDLGFVRILPLTISRCGNGYSISTRMFFADPIGNTVFVNTNTEEHGIWKRGKKIELDLKKPLRTGEELGKDIAYGLMVVERVVNYAYEVRGLHNYDSYVVDAKLIEEQIERKKKIREMESRHEKLEPFKIVHAESAHDLSILSKDLVPFFWEYDKFDLFGGKGMYCMFPRNFAAALLKCDKSALIPEEQFGKYGKEFLDELVRRKHLKRREFAGKPCYFDLNEQTRRYLVKALRSGFQ